MTEKKTTDVLGLAAYGEAIKVVAQGAVDGAGAFLGRICLPAAEELGLLLRDRVAVWRQQNLIAITQKAQQMLGGAPEVHAHPRMVWEIVQNGSLVDDETLQDMWAGLLASACSPDGHDESNLIFIGLLNGLTSSEVHILNDACASATKKLSPAGWLEAERQVYAAGRIVEITGVSDLHRLDRELDHLRALGLLTVSAGFMVKAQDKVADLTPSTLGLQMYARCCGSRDSPEVFFGLAGGPAKPST